MPARLTIWQREGDPPPARSGAEPVAKCSTPAGPMLRSHDVRRCESGVCCSGLVLVLLVAALSGWVAGPYLHRAYEAMLTLLDLANRAPAAVLDVRPTVSRNEIQYRGLGPRRRADLYLPPTVLAGIVLIVGAAPQGKSDPRVIALATALGRARFAVLVPDIVDLKALKLAPESAVDVADALHYMLARPRLIPEGRVGLLTTSVGVGPALLAVLDSALSHRVRFLVSIGAYYDLPRTLKYLTTGHYDALGISIENTPNQHGKWAYALSNAGRLEEFQDRRLFATLARRKLEDPGASVDHLLGRLGPEARKIYDFVANEDPDRSHGLLMQLPQTQRSDIAALNLAAHDLKGLKLRFILVHGLDDSIIPYGESLALAEGLAGGRAETFLLQGLLHVDVAPELMDSLRMWRAVYALLSERH